MTGLWLVGGLGFGVPGGGLGDEAGEEGAGGGVVFEAALRVPLDAEGEGVAGCVGGVFDGFDDSVFGAAGGDAEAVAGDADGLVVAGVDSQPLAGRFEVRGSRNSEGFRLSSESGARAAMWATATEGPAEWLTGMGVRCCTSVPPRHTFSIWMPKQMARMGLPMLCAS